MRVYSYLFHGLLALFLLAISGLDLAGSAESLHLSMLPWTGAVLTRWVFFSALFGLVSLLLAIAGKLRVLFFFWSLAVAVMLIRGYFLTSYHFRGAEEFKTALYLTAAALLAILGAWFQLRRKPQRV